MNDERGNHNLDSREMNSSSLKNNDAVIIQNIDQNNNVVDSTENNLNSKPVLIRAVSVDNAIGDNHHLETDSINTTNQTNNISNININNNQIDIGVQRYDSQSDLTTQNIQSVQTNQVVQNNLTTQNIQSAQTNQVVQNNLNTQNTQSAQSNQVVQNNLNTQNTQSVQTKQVIQNNSNLVTNQSPQRNQLVLGDEDLLRAYVGENYDKIKNQKFNVWALLFGLWYFFYRKMILFSILVLFLMLVFIVVFDIIVFIIIDIIINVILALTVNKLYLNFWVPVKIKKIKKNNPTMGLDELKQICSKKGGTNISFVVVGLLLTIIMTIVFAYAIPSQPVPSPTPQDVLPVDTSIEIEKSFTLIAPDIFIDDSEFSKYIFINRSKKEEYNACRFELNAIPNYSTGLELISDLNNQYLEISEISKIKTIEKNGHKWYYFKKETSNETTYYYGTDITNDTEDDKERHVYLFKYTKEKNAISDCLDYRTQVFNSITEEG